MSQLHATVLITRIRPASLIRRLLLLVSAATLAVIGSGIASPVAHAAGLTCTVTPGRGSYPTINSATSGTSGATCTTVVLPAGKFTEQVVIDHALTLTGAGATRTMILHPAPGPNTKSIIENGDAEDYVIDVTAPGVTISKLTIDGASYGCQTHNTCGSSNAQPYFALFGVALQARNFTLASVTFQHLGNTKQQGQGVPIGGQTIVTGGNGGATLKNSIFQSFTGLALMELNTEPAPFTFTGNKVFGTSANVFGLLTAGNNAQITGNTFMGFHHVGKAAQNLLPPSMALVIFGAGDTVSGNSFTDDDSGIIVTGANGTNTVANNSFMTTQSAIMLGQNTAGQVVRNNKISNATAGKNLLAIGAGILLCQESGDQVSGNTITTSVYGVAVLDSAQSQCAAPAQPSSISNNKITRSKKDDLFDQTQSGGTGGTMDTYTGNTCHTSSPRNLCGTHALTRAVGLNAANQTGQHSGVTSLFLDALRELGWWQPTR